MSIFNIDLLPAREGDCIWIEYGDAVHPRRVLVDGGRPLAWQTLKKRFASLPEDQREFELLILSHVDADHIEGLLRMLSDPDVSIRFKDVWFNGRRHLEKEESFGSVQGEAFSDGINAKGWKWNDAFRGRSVVIPETGELPVILLAGGMTLTLLSPTREKLEALAPDWDAELRKAGLLGQEDPDTDDAGLESFGGLSIAAVQEAAESDFEGDDSSANGSSICVLAKFDGRSAVLTGDGHAPLLEASLRKLRNGSDRLKVSAYKLSHHGSHGTHSVGVMEQIEAERFLVSTDGSRHKHPHVEAIARTVAHSGGAELIFNYASQFSLKWDDQRLRDHFGYRTRYPDESTPGFVRIAL